MFGYHKHNVGKKSAEGREHHHHHYIKEQRQFAEEGGWGHDKNRNPHESLHAHHHEQRHAQRHARHQDTRFAEDVEDRGRGARREEAVRGCEGMGHHHHMHHHNRFAEDFEERGRGVRREDVVRCCEGIGHHHHMHHHKEHAPKGFQGWTREVEAQVQRGRHNHKKLKAFCKGVFVGTQGHEQRQGCMGGLGCHRALQGASVGVRAQKNQNIEVQLSGRAEAGALRTERDGLCPLCKNHCPLSAPSCPRGQAYAAGL